MSWTFTNYHKQYDQSQSGDLVWTYCTQNLALHDITRESWHSLFQSCCGNLTVAISSHAVAIFFKHLSTKWQQWGTSMQCPGLSQITNTEFIDKLYYIPPQLHIIAIYSDVPAYLTVMISPGRPNSNYWCSFSNASFPGTLLCWTYLTGHYPFLNLTISEQIL